MGYAQLAELEASLGRPSTREEFIGACEAFVRFCTDDPARYQLLFQRTIPGFEPSPA